MKHLTRLASLSLLFVSGVTFASGSGGGPRPSIMMMTIESKAESGVGGGGGGVHPSLMQNRLNGVGGGGGGVLPTAMMLNSAINSAMNVDFVKSMGTDGAGNIKFAYKAIDRANVEIVTSSIDDLQSVYIKALERSQEVNSWQPVKY